MLCSWRIRCANGDTRYNQKKICKKTLIWEKNNSAYFSSVIRRNVEQNIERRFFIFSRFQ
jgi:hypothetical protein